jgi:transposase-like protein
MIDIPECPHCRSALINQHGKAETMQRYCCKNSMKTFNAVTDTPFLIRLKSTTHNLSELVMVVTALDSDFFL